MEKEIENKNELKPSEEEPKKWGYDEITCFKKPDFWDGFYKRDKIKDDLFLEKSKVFKKDRLEELQKTANAFLKEYMDSKLFLHHSFLGINCVKNPFDLMLFQEIIYRLKPENIIETGGGFCGSAFFYAMIMELLGLPGKVYTCERLTYNLYPTIETIQKRQITSNRIVYFKDAFSIDQELLLYLKEKIGDKNNLVILDSDHQESYTLIEMMYYEKFVQPGGYMIVEDTCLSNHPCKEKYSMTWKGPWESVEKFLKLPDQIGRWVQDRSCDLKYILTNNPGGYLRKIE